MYLQIKALQALLLIHIYLINPVPKLILITFSKNLIYRATLVEYSRLQPSHHNHITFHFGLMVF